MKKAIKWELYYEEIKPTWRKVQPKRSVLVFGSTILRMFRRVFYRLMDVLG